MQSLKAFNIVHTNTGKQTAGAGGCVEGQLHINQSRASRSFFVLKIKGIPLESLCAEGNLCLPHPVALQFQTQALSLLWGFTTG